MWDFDIRIIFSIYDRALLKFDLNLRHCRVSLFKERYIYCKVAFPHVIAR